MPPLLRSLAAAAAGLALSLSAASASESLTRDLIVQPNQEALYAWEPEASALEVKAWVDQEDRTYEPGETLTLYVKTNQPAYLTVIDQGTSGKVHVIYPNRYQDRERIEAQRVVRIPSEDAPFRLRVGGPAGTELIKVIATTKPDPLISPEALAETGPVSVYRGTAESLTRDLTVELKQPQQGPQTDSAVAQVVVRIVEREADASSGTEPGSASAEMTPEQMFRRGLAASFEAYGTPNYQAAAEWFRRAADAGHAPAMFRLGWLNEQGFGADRDLKSARAWYRKAADLGHPAAMTHLAQLFLDGRGGSQDYEQGRRWLERAADAGEGAAMATLAGVYDRGFGVAPDASLAARMVLGALRHGHWRLQEYLREFSAETRREIQQRLSVAGYYDGEIDGIIGPETQAALVDYALAG